MNPIKTAFRAALGRRLPITEGVLAVDGLEQPVTIGRDRFGIPHITAKSDADAWFALGFCQGQDRAFQTDMLARVARGRVSEMAGKDTLAIDRLSRRVGFRRTAEETMHLCDDVERRGLESFAAGINAGRAQGLAKKAHEYALLRSDPLPFEAIDSLAIFALMAFSLASNWDAELARLAILTQDGPTALADLDPSYPEWHPVTNPPGVPAGPAATGLLEDMEQFRATVGLGGGSNNWAVAASKTATGRPIMANDPHLAPVLPPHWYLAHLMTPEWSIAGATLAGTPGFAAGHNGHVAWGVTAGSARQHRPVHRRTRTRRPHRPRGRRIRPVRGPPRTDRGEGWRPCRRGRCRHQTWPHRRPGVGAHRAFALDGRHLAGAPGGDGAPQLRHG